MRLLLHGNLLTFVTDMKMNTAMRSMIFLLVLLFSSTAIFAHYVPDLSGSDKKCLHVTKTKKASHQHTTDPFEEKERGITEEGKYDDKTERFVPDVTTSYKLSCTAFNLTYSISLEATLCARLCDTPIYLVKRTLLI